MGKNSASGVSVLARGAEAEPSTRAAHDADIAARYSVEPRRDDEYTIAEFGALTGRRYDAARDFLRGLVAAGTWTRRKCGNGYVYREVKP